MLGNETKSTGGRDRDTELLLILTFCLHIYFNKNFFIISSHFLIFYLLVFIVLCVQGGTRRPPLKIGKTNVGVKSWFFTGKTPKFFAPPFAQRNFVNYALLTWNPGVDPMWIILLSIYKKAENMDYHRWPSQDCVVIRCNILFTVLSDNGLNKYHFNNKNGTHILPRVTTRSLWLLTMSSKLMNCWNRPDFPWAALFLTGKCCFVMFLSLIFKLFIIFRLDTK